MNTNSSAPQKLIAVSGKLGSGKDLITSIIQIMTCEDREIVEEFYETPIKTLNSYTGVFELQSQFENRKFAGLIKKIVAEMLNCTIRQLEDRVFKETELGPEWWYYSIGGEKIPYLDTNYTDEERVALETFLVKLTPRRMTVLVGTEGGRDILHPSVWVNSLMSKYVPNEEGELPNWVISDLRFKSEKSAVEAKGGKTIRVVRYKLLSEWCTDFAIDLEQMSEYENLKISDKDFLNFINELGSEILDDVADKLNHISEVDLDEAEFDYVIDNDGTVEELVNKVREILITEGVVLTDTIVQG